MKLAFVFLLIVSIYGVFENKVAAAIIDETLNKEMINRSSLEKRPGVEIMIHDLEIMIYDSDTPIDTLEVIEV